MTVSRVLSDENHKVSEETRERVLKVVRELEYVPVAQPVTQSRHNETRTIGLVFDGTPFEGQWGLPTFVGFRDGAAKSAYDLLVLTRPVPEWMADRGELQFLDRRSDGLIFVAPHGHYQILEALVERGVPVVTCYTNDAPPQVPSIVIDNRDAMRQAVRCLHEKGHERILHLTNSVLERTDFKERREGYNEAMRDRNLEPAVMEIKEWPWTRAGEDLLEAVRKHRSTALVCYNDRSAILAWDALVESGLKVPQDISITGMDDLAVPAQRGLTSVHFSCEEVGRRAMETVVNLIQGEKTEFENCMVPVELVERASIAPPP